MVGVASVGVKDLVRRLLDRLTCLGGAVLVAALLGSTVPSPVSAQQLVWPSSPPDGTKGWCTPALPVGTGGACYPSPAQACQRQFQDYAWSGKIYLGYRPYPLGTWASMECMWGPWGGPAPTTVNFLCEYGYSRVAPGICVPQNTVYPSRPCDPCQNHGGTPTARTGRPIDILTGAKSFDVVDFETSDGLLRVSRHFKSLSGGGPSNLVFARPAGMTNWQLGDTLELHLGYEWNNFGRTALLSPRGGYYPFLKSGTAMVPYKPSDYPQPSTDYAVEFVGTWPGTLSEVKQSKSAWIVRDAEDRVWRLETFFNPDTEKWDIARPVLRVEPTGAEVAYVYDAQGALRMMTDSYGRQLAFEWYRMGGVPRAIASVALPDGTRLDYAYDGLSIAATTPDRLARVERRDAASALLDKTTYQYGDDRYPFFVTGVLDKNDAVRWSVTYDSKHRALTSAGPSGVDQVTMGYGASDGTSFSRTVTNALGLVTTYNYTRPSVSGYDIKLASVVTTATANVPSATTPNTYGTDKFLSAMVDAESRTTAYTRDSLGRTTQLVEAQGTTVARTSTTTWHSAVSQPTQIAAPGLTTNVTLTSATSSGYAPTYAATQAFAYTGAGQTYTVPGGVTSATVELWGAAGGNGNYEAGTWSGAGGYVKATFAVTPGDVLTFEVASGGQGAMRSADGGAGGWPDGGPGAKGNRGSGGGGGSTRLYINGVLKAVAGGGGGSGGLDGPNSGSAGAGGGTVGQDAKASGASGGSSTAGGLDTSDPTTANKTGRSIIAFPGAQRLGGWGSTTGDSTTLTSDDGGGGGGGYWGGGGGGGDGEGGGGGSSWIASGATSVENLGGNRHVPAKTPTGQPTVATGVNSAVNGPAVAGGSGYAIVGVR